MEIRELDRKQTGENIKRLMRRSGLTTLDLQVIFQLTSPSPIYAWTQGKYMPRPEALVILAQIFRCQVDDILVLEEKE